MIHAHAHPRGKRGEEIQRDRRARIQRVYSVCDTDPVDGDPPFPLGLIERQATLGKTCSNTGDVRDTDRPQPLIPCDEQLDTMTLTFVIIR